MKWDPVTTFNLALSAAIFVLAMIGWAKVKNALALFIGLAFGLFAVAHLATIMGWSDTLFGLLIVIHAIAYVFVIVAVYKVAFPQKKEY